jgi:hypothetical protein
MEPQDLRGAISRTRLATTSETAFENTGGAETVARPTPKTPRRFAGRIFYLHHTEYFSKYA